MTVLKLDQTEIKGPPIGEGDVSREEQYPSPLKNQLTHNMMATKAACGHSWETISQ